MLIKFLQGRERKWLSDVDCETIRKNVPQRNLHLMSSSVYHWRLGVGTLAYKGNFKTVNQLRPKNSFTNEKKETLLLTRSK